MRKISAIALASLVLFGCVASTVGESGGELLIRNVQIISPENVIARHSTDVLVRNGRIFDIGEKAASQASGSAAILDGTGRYLPPATTR